MLSIKLIKTVTEKLRQVFPVEYKDIDITEGFSRPCLSVDISDFTSEYLTPTRIRENIPIMIYYFAPKREKAHLNLISMREKLKAIFRKPIEIDKGFFVFSPEFEASINSEDGSLIVTLYFLLEYEDSYIKTKEFEQINKISNTEDENEELMETLHFHY